ncbi:MAG TPA: anti-sigma factor [Jiangellaceae bacterium]|nr:anti-sigma factor [Jiangellaceae bacterium]
MAHDADIHTLAVPYALDALPPEDVELFERHRQACSACQAEVDEVRLTLTRLGRAVEVDPPAQLKTQVMERIRSVRPLPPPAEPSVPDRSRRPSAQRWRLWWPRLAVGVAAAMTLVVVALASMLSDVRSEVERLEATEAQVSSLLESSDAELARATVDGATGTVVMARSLDTAVLVADGMDPAPDGQIYQLWYIADDGIRSAGLLGTTHAGRIGPFTAGDLGNAAALAITVEPEGGSEQPTTDPEMVIELPTT